MDPRPLWITLCALTATGALVGGPLGVHRRWPLSVMAAGTVLTAVLLSVSVVHAWGWHTLWGLLLVLFPLHGLAFLALGLKRRQPRLLLVCLTFAALSVVAWLRFSGAGLPGLQWLLRGIAIAATGLSLGLWLRSRRRAR